MKSKKPKYECKHCQIPLQKKFKGQPVCNELCFSKWEVEESKIKYPDGVECLECGIKRNDIKLHVKKIHSMSVEEYREKYGNVPMIAESTKHIYSSQWSGENNPGFQHNGARSPFSKKNSKYDEEWHKERSSRHSEFMKFENDNNHFQKDYYDTDFEYLSHQRKNLDFFIQKYGVEEGTKRHRAKTEKWLSTLNSKSDDEKAEINRKKVVNIGSISQPERELADIISESFKIERQFYLREGIAGYKFDIRFQNKLVEFNGDYWHMNPSKYMADSYNPTMKLSAKEIWNRDDAKLETARRNGFDVFTVWENDYKKNKDKVIEECINFLTS